MYNTAFVVKYYDIENELYIKLKDLDSGDDESYTREDVMVVCEKLYRDEFISVFNLDEYDEEKLIKSLKELFDIIKENKELVNILHEINKLNIFPLKEEERLFSNFITLFSQQLFHITHKCICQLLTTNNIEKYMLEQLHNSVILLFETNNKLD